MIAAARALLARPTMLRHQFFGLFTLCGWRLGSPEERMRRRRPRLRRPPRWEAAVGGSFVGTSGNTDTSTVGADLALQRRWSVWRMEVSAVAISTSDQGEQSAERYLATLRAKRQLTPLLGLAAGERVERDRFAGIDLRSILDGGLT